MAESITQTFLIPAFNLPELEKRIEKLNRRCRKLGVQEITLEKKKDHVRWKLEWLTVDLLSNYVWTPEDKAKAALKDKRWPKTDTGERMEWWAVTVTGESPKLADWTFVATLEPVEVENGEKVNIIATVPGQECPAEYRTAIGRCDHCNVDRYRRQTFVVKKEVKGTRVKGKWVKAHTEWKCVGRQCLKDFLGYNADPQGLAAQAEVIASLGSLMSAAQEEGWSSGSYKPNEWDLTYFLSWVASRIDRAGWMSKGRAYDMMQAHLATANVVLDLLTPPHPTADAKVKTEWRQWVAEHQPQEPHVRLAEDAVEWARTITDEEINGAGGNYLANVNTIARSGSVTVKLSGVAASIIVAYKRRRDEEIKRQEFDRKPPSEWIGSVKERLTLKVKVDKVMLFHSQNGIRAMYRMDDPAGSTMVYWGPPGLMTEGQSYDVRATVKGHTDYKGRKQTTLTRLEVIAALQEMS